MGGARARSAKYACNAQHRAPANSAPRALRGAGHALEGGGAGGLTRTGCSSGWCGSPRLDPGAHRATPPSRQIKRREKKMATKTKAPWRRMSA
jgi:hypothetical protein